MEVLCVHGRSWNEYDIICDDDKYHDGDYDDEEGDYDEEDDEDGGDDNDDEDDDYDEEDDEEDDDKRACHVALQRESRLTFPPTAPAPVNYIPSTTLYCIMYICIKLV